MIVYHLMTRKRQYDTAFVCFCLVDIVAAVANSNICPKFKKQTFNFVSPPVPLFLLIATSCLTSLCTFTQAQDRPPPHQFQTPRFENPRLPPSLPHVQIPSPPQATPLRSCGRVVKCHRYGRYICVKLLEGLGKKFTRPHNLNIQKGRLGPRVRNVFASEGTLAASCS